MFILFAKLFYVAFAVVVLSYVFSRKTKPVSETNVEYASRRMGPLEAGYVSYIRNKSDIDDSLVTGHMSQIEQLTYARELFESAIAKLRTL